MWGIEEMIAGTKVEPAAASRHSPIGAPASGEGSRWLNLRGWDAAKAGLTLYIVGMLTSGIYYARFHVLALDFTRIQSIVVGIYLIAIYLAAPAAAIWCVRRLSDHRSVRITVCILSLAGVDIGLGWLLKCPWGAMPLRSLSTLLIQLMLFVDGPALWTSIRQRRFDLQLMHQPTRARMVALGVVVCVHFATLWFPRIPGNFAGGMPVHVQVFTEMDGLPDSRFAPTLNNPQINTKMDSYALWLLYQTDTDVYLLDSLPVDGSFLDDDVMRITQGQVIRMDYNTAP
jgi:hypothetical protein